MRVNRYTMLNEFAVYVLHNNARFAKARTKGTSYEEVKY